jgi:hypothetical protein
LAVWGGWRCPEAPPSIANRFQTPTRAQYSEFYQTNPSSNRRHEERPLPKSRLEQAAQSPLFYRQGSKVVRHGFNDYRSGYDGGALKTGQLPTGRFSMETRQRTSTPPGLTPFERLGGGGGHLANVCFSMHSEMMAIHSALASSSTLAASTASHIKPCFKLPGRHAKPGRLLRTGGGGGTLKFYVESVCLEAMRSEVQRGTGAAPGHACRFEAGTSGRDSASEQQHQPQSESDQNNPNWNPNRNQDSVGKSYENNNQRIAASAEDHGPHANSNTISGDGDRRQAKSNKDVRPSSPPTPSVND